MTSGDAILNFTEEDSAGTRGRGGAGKTSNHRWPEDSAEDTADEVQLQLQQAVLKRFQRFISPSFHP